MGEAVAVDLPAYVSAVRRAHGNVRLEGARNVSHKPSETQPCGGIQFEMPPDGVLRICVALRDLPGESECYIGFAPVDADLGRPTVMQESGVWFCPRNQTLCAQDGTCGKDFAKQKFLLLAGQQLGLTYDRALKIVKLFKDGIFMGECIFNEPIGSMVDPTFRPTIAFKNTECVLTICD